MTMRLLHACGLTWCAGQRLPHWSALSAALAVQADLLGLQGSTPISNANDAAALTLAAPNLHPINVYVNSDAARLPTTALSELTLQAASGIMSVHGRSSGKANPLGVEYLTVLTAAMTLQAALAAAVGQLRGGAFREVHVSPVACGLLSIGQYLAGATAPEDPERFLPGQYSPTLRPPFVSSDGVVFELETLDSSPWRQFWQAAGISADVAGQAWKAFLLRYAKAVSPIPDACMNCLSRLSFTRVQELARQAGIAVVPVRTLAARQCDADYQPSTAPWAFAAHAASHPTNANSVPVDLPLRGLRVIESCRRIQGPLAGHLLAMLGAEVIRLEPPGGDPLRAMPPCADGVSVRFDALNHLKTVQEVDIKSAAGKQTIYALAREADVFLHNWAPGKAAEMALDAKHLHAVRSDLVYAYAGGWGDARVDAPGTDFTVQAYSGVADAIAKTSGARGGSLFTVLDVLGGVIATLGVTAALLHRRLHKSGVAVESSLLGAADHLMQVTQSIARAALLSGLYATRQGVIAIDCQTDAQLAALAQWLGVPNSVSACEAALQRQLPEYAATACEAELNVRSIPASAVVQDLAQLQRDTRLATYLGHNAYSSVNSPWRFA